MNQYKRKIALIINKPSWAIGTLARLFVLGRPAHWHVRIFTHYQINSLSNLERSLLNDMDLVHWMLHRTISGGEGVAPNAIRTASVHHLDEEEQYSNLPYLMDLPGIIVHASAYRDILCARGWEPDRITIMPYVVDNPFFSLGSRRLAQRRKTPRTFRVGFFASAEYESNRKGIDLLPSILRHLQTRGVPVELWVTGLGWQKLLNDPEFASLPIRHVIAPSYFDMPALYQRLDAYLCVSRIEGGPMPVFEAAASGVPIVSTGVGMVPQFLDNEDSFLQIGYDDSMQAADALEQVFRDTDGDLKRCKAAQESITIPFSLGRYQACLIQYYAKLLAEEPNRVPALNSSQSRALRRTWRAWDHIYYSKECWSAGEHAMSLRYFAEGAVLDPFGDGVWRTVRKCLRPGRRD